MQEFELVDHFHTSERGLVGSLLGPLVEEYDVGRDGRDEGFEVGNGEFGGGGAFGHSQVVRYVRVGWSRSRRHRTLDGVSLKSEPDVA